MNLVTFYQSQPRWLRRSVVVLIAIPTALIGTAQLLAYQPPELETLAPIHEPSSTSDRPPDSIRLLTWNVGYAGLDAREDFFMDGGHRVFPIDESHVSTNLGAILAKLRALSFDVSFLQEVDRRSERSWNKDEAARIWQALPHMNAWYAPNFRVAYIPYPWQRPLGHVESGLVTLTGFSASNAKRHQLPGDPPWPTRLFHLKRCALVLTAPSSAPGHPWVFANVHLSAFDDGSQRTQQLAYLKRQMTSWYRAGARVILGGDWNSVFPGVDRDQFKPYTTSAENLRWVRDIPPQWTPPGWTWAFDKTHPTVRTNDGPYRPKRSYRTIIDGFLLSPNVKLLSVRTLELHFEHSDHNPVAATVTSR